MKQCPVCEGSKFSPIGGHLVCKCCGGAGQISVEKDEALREIRYALKNKLNSLYPNRYNKP